MANRTRMRLFGLCLMTLCLALAPMQTAAQSQAGSGTIVGTVYDSSGAVVPKAKVTAAQKGTGFTREAEANDSGQYRIILLPPGSYTVTVAQSGFKTYKGEIDVTVGSTPTLDIRLTVGAASETIEVTASVVVETTTSTSDALINERSIDSLPINGRRFHDFVTLTPTVQIEPSRNGISFAGQRGINANVTIDGADYNQPFFGGIRGGERANTAFSIPQESIQEFQVVAYGYSAEFGRSTAGVLNAVTKSGQNEFHGSGFYFGRYDNFARRDAFNRKVIDNQHQFGGSFGGPIVQDRAFFFFSPEFQEISTPRAVEFPTLVTTTGLVRNAFNADAFDYYDSLQEDFTSTNDAKTILGKADFQLNQNHRAFVRYHWSTNTAANAVATGDAVTTATTSALSNDGIEGNRTHTLSGQWTGLFSNSLVNELRAQWGREERPREANSAMTTVQTIVGFFGTRSFLPTTQEDTRFQIADSINWTRGAHSVKFGGDFNRLRASQFFKFDQFGFFLSPTVPTGCTTNSATSPGGSVGWQLRLLTVGTDPAATGNCVDPANRYDHTGASYRVNIGNGEADINGSELAFFVHDTWRMHPRFTFNIGFRWEGYYNPSPDVSNTAMYNLVANFPFPNGRSVDPAIIPDNTDQFMPRAGFAWDPWGDSKTVIRANAGIYYARTPYLLYAGPINNFRTPAGDLRVTMPFVGANGLALTGCAGSGGSNPATVAPLAPGDTCNTLYWQMRRIGIDLNTLSLDSLPTLTPTDLNNIAGALGLAIDPNRGAAPLTLANNFESPRSWQWSFGFDRELANGWSVGAEYVYINTVHLQRNREYNLPTPSPCPDISSAAALVPDFHARPTYHLLGGTGSGCPNGTGFTTPSLSRPLPTLSSMQVRESNSRALYRAVTFKSVYRKSKWQLQTYYTLGKNLSDDDNERDAGGQAAMNAFNLQEDYGFSRLDTRHLLLINGMYDLPWDFQVSGLGRFRSGRPMNATVGTDLNEDGINNDRPYSAPGTPFPRNSFRDRAVYDFDLRVSKMFKLGEKARFDVTADFFNLFNIHNVTFGGTTGIYGVGIDRTTGAVAPIDTRFQQLFNPTNCNPTSANFNSSCYDRNNIPGRPFQMQLGFRFQF